MSLEDERNPFLERLRSNTLTLMLGIRGARTSDIVRIAKSTGYHAVMVDLEHSSMPLDVAASICATAGDLDLAAFVRVPERDYGSIGRLLDCGASGIVAPRIETAAEAEDVSWATRFPPNGQRSQLTMVPQFGMRPTPAKILNPALDRSTIVQILIETPKGFENVDAIAAVPGVDIIAIGANDFTAELGVPGDFRDPRIKAAVSAAAAACRRHGKLLMLGGIGDLSIVGELMPLGIAPLILSGMDSDMLFSIADTRARALTEWYSQHNSQA